MNTDLNVFLVATDGISRSDMHICSTLQAIQNKGFLYCKDSNGQGILDYMEKYTSSYAIVSLLLSKLKDNELKKLINQGDHLINKSSELGVYLDKRLYSIYRQSTPIIYSRQSIPSKTIENTRKHRM